jgi:hypothetical protein
MGRLRFVQRTLPRVLEDPNARSCIVDHSCPEGTADWIERTFAEEVRRGRVLIERVEGQRFFNKCRAHNVGARRALHAGADYLCFLDADTLVEPGLWDFMRAQARPDRFLVAAAQSDGSPMPSLTGFLVVHGAAFERGGGFDEAFIGWGGEDLELRLRLHLVEGLDSGEVPLSLLRPIGHSNALRVQFQEDRNITRSHHGNIARILNKLQNDWIHRLKRDLSSARRLVFPRSLLHDALSLGQPSAQLPRGVHDQASSTDPDFRARPAPQHRPRTGDQTHDHGFGRSPVRRLRTTRTRFG